MQTPQPFTKDDAKEFGESLEKLFDAKLGTVNERLTGLRNWVIGTFGAFALIATSGVVTHQQPPQQIKTAIALARALL